MHLSTESSARRPTLKVVSDMTKVLSALFDDGLDAARAIDELFEIGIHARDVSVIASDPTVKETFAIETHSKLPEGTAIGAGVGGAVGAVVGGLTAFGALSTGGVALVAAGPLLAALAGAGAGAAGGSAIGGLVGLAIPETEVHFYEDALGKGSVLVGLHYTDTEQRKAAEAVLKRHNALKIRCQ